MSSQFDALSESNRWRTLVDAAKRAAQEQGYALSRVPGRGMSNVWNIEKNGKILVASIRTTRDRWIAFPPLEGGKKWKTLDGVGAVIVAALDSKDDAKNVEVYYFPADEVRARFNAAYAARAKDGHKIPDNFGMWIALDPDSRGIASSVGAGLAAKYKPIATYPLDALLSAMPSSPEQEVPTGEDVEPEESRPASIAEVMAWARERVAELAGVRAEAVKLDLKIEY